MAIITMVGGDEEPLSHGEQREWDRIQFNSIIAPFIGDALFSETRIRAETAKYGHEVDQFVVPVDLPPEA